MKFKIKPETAISVALGVLGVVQMLLTNKKEADNRAAMKNELKEEISKELLEKNNQEAQAFWFYFFIKFMRKEKINEQTKCNKLY